MRFGAEARGTLNLVLIGMVAIGTAALVGCGSSGNGGGGGGGGTTAPTGALASGGATNIFAIQGTETGAGSSILAFSADTSGSEPASGTLVTPSTFGASAVATDSAGQLYVGGYSTTTGSAEILVYPAGATGIATPTRTIDVDPDDGIAIATMTVDASGQIYVAGANESGMVAVFAAGANGSVEPTALLTSATLTAPLGVAVDSTGKIYVSNIAFTDETASGGQILVFAAGANGTDAPVQTISTAAATATSLSIFYGVAVDASGNIFAVEDSGTFDSSGDETGSTGAVVKFAAGATGIATPTETITGSSAGFSYGGGLRLDSVGNFYLITEADVNDVPTYTLLGFGPNASGNVAPGVTITSGALNDAGSEIAVH